MHLQGPGEFLQHSHRGRHRASLDPRHGDVADFGVNGETTQRETTPYPPLPESDPHAVLVADLLPDSQGPFLVVLGFLGCAPGGGNSPLATTASRSVRLSLVRLPTLTTGSRRWANHFLIAAGDTASMIAASGMESSGGVMDCAGCTSVCPLRPGFGVPALTGAMAFVASLES
jgi:hypothetical protein